MADAPKSTNQATKPKKPGSKVSIYDVAAHIGVSPGTVSRVINNRDRVKTSTREKVLAAARELGFAPQAAVRRREIAVITEEDYRDRIAGYSASLTQHLAFELTRREMALQLPEAALDSLQTAYINGIIVVSHGPHVEAAIEQLEKRLPVVHIDLFEKTKDRYTVNSDHEQAGYLAALHFVECGRKRPAFFAYDGAPNRARLRGFKRGLQEAGLSLDENLFLTVAQGEPFYVALNSLVRMRADAVYVPGSSMEAVEALHLLHYVLKQEIPKDIAVIGGENDRLSSLLVPPLTTIEEPLGDLAIKAVEMLQTLMDGDKPAKAQVTLPVKLIRRASGG
ncbi:MULTISPECIES: LacI family DNA-binding transcriptional regulator [unclassified Lentimonas]|uniref:LacI family DNA-binding transcriptional regulator n=1 Tax=unclassified Lentimonas TaxID=2630993 RepID=UPI001328CAE9|nr:MULTISPECIES: LacI family DNA-binding transcriptional regulator [unclassified Lentimonas]CAA6679357.1 Unannotated [Lentimonas sp. CC4]CAA6687364.1 Unannotated [Lentimonas sp. CC6]CAA7078036.1 Unannotated [Lentimonas sp. CC4]CAA7168006.1 Unannotated [Lentimonas sp. CC21]CAA7179581.1 Unannotated [Lentimonas sp. CC8]